MSFSGITIYGLCKEFRDKLLNGRIQRISQPDRYELLITVHGETGNHRLYISINPSFPLIYLTDKNKPSSMTAYNFVMVLRKYIGNARITDISQMGLERVVCITLSHLDEMKDNATKYMYVEIMGKHSNIIFTDENNNIIDAIKHVGISQSSVREVLPGKPYFIPKQQDRFDLFTIDKNTFFNKVLYKQTTIEKAIPGAFTGFSNLTAYELCARCELFPETGMDILHESEREALWQKLMELKEALINYDFTPTIIYNNKKPLEFSIFDLSCYEGMEKQSYESISSVIDLFYDKKNNDNQIKQKTADIRKIITTLIERGNKKLLIQEKQLSDTDKKDMLRLYGELLQTYGYCIAPKEKSVTVNNYYDNNPITIPLNPDYSGIDNSKLYFKKYDKLKRTREALLPQISATKYTIEHLKSIEASLSMAENNEDIANIKRELYENGFIRKRPENTKNSKKTPLLHYITPQGFDLYVGKNNYQNEEVTFKLAKGEDWWFHAKNMPGSHVILKANGREIPDEVFEMAAGLAAYYSSGRESTNVEVDYLKRKDIKRVPGAAKGFVIYYSNYSMTVPATIDGLSLV